jgi:type VI secretion system protein ImpL
MSPTSLKDKAAAKAKELIASAQGDAGKKAREKSPVEERLMPLIRFGVGDQDAAAGSGGPAPLAQCIEELRTLEVKLEQLRASQGAPTEEFHSELAQTASTVERLLTRLDGATRLLVEPLLMNPIRGSRTGVATTATSALGEKWKAEVWSFYAEKIAQRYPFGSGPDVALADFSDFFRPEGVLWGFFERNLQGQLERSGSNFAPRPSLNPTSWRGDFLRCLTHAQQITDAVFGSSPKAEIPITVKLETSGPDVAEARFTLDGETVVYRNEPERWFPMHWPGKGPARGAALPVRGKNFTDEIPRHGDFGFFRFLAAGNVKPQKGPAPTFVASYALSRAGTEPALVAIRPSRSVHPFHADFFKRLRCPDNPTLAASSPGPP